MKIVIMGALVCFEHHKKTPQFLLFELHPKS